MDTGNVVSSPKRRSIVVAGSIAVTVRVNCLPVSASGRIRVLLPSSSGAGTSRSYEVPLLATT